MALQPLTNCHSSRIVDAGKLEVHALTVIAPRRSRSSVARRFRKRDDDLMKFGFVVPWADAAEIGELAAVAELHGWDGLFVWEPVWGVDAWVSLAVAACRTKRLRLGTMLTPLPRRKPWELAGQAATVDRLSNGRVIVSVGLGAPDSGYEAFGEQTDKVVRGELLDEGLASSAACGPASRSPTTASTTRSSHATSPPSATPSSYAVCRSGASARSDRRSR